MAHEIDGATAGRICVSIARQDIGHAIQAARKVQALADVIEIRLDSLAAPVIEPFLQAIDIPLLFTNRPAWEGGLYSGPEEQRLALLMQAARCKAAYVDIELQSDPSAVHRLCEAARESGTRVIISWHDFRGTPGEEELAGIFARQQASGAGIGKIVTMAQDFTDVLRVLQLQELAHGKGFPLIAFCMGRAGMVSRLATLELGGFMTYAAPDAGEATAPGQLAVADLVRCVKHLRYAD
jgi:3-dehydroquinate dehydratase-1/3-dehydroquinate dehydratase/shikimate dehydrogenase